MTCGKLEVNMNNLKLMVAGLSIWEGHGRLVWIPEGEE